MNAIHRVYAASLLFAATATAPLFSQGVTIGGPVTTSPIPTTTTVPGVTIGGPVTTSPIPTTTTVPGVTIGGPVTTSPIPSTSLTVPQATPYSPLPDASPTAPEPEPIPAIEAQLDFSSLLCIKETGEGSFDWFYNPSDEVFVSGAWERLDGSESGTIALPGKTSHYGDVDAMEWVFKSRKLLWKGMLEDRQSVGVQVRAMEKDSGYTAGEYAKDMAGNLASGLLGVVIGGGVPWGTIADSIATSIKFVFGNGSNDYLGMFTVVLTNEGGQLKKELHCHDDTEIGSATRRVFKTLWTYETDKIQYYKSQGYSEIYSTITQVTLMNEVKYGELSKSRKTIRMVLDGDGPQKYHGSIQVRADGVFQLWTKINDKRGR